MLPTIDHYMQTAIGQVRSQALVKVSTSACGLPGAEFAAFPAQEVMAFPKSRVLLKSPEPRPVPITYFVGRGKNLTWRDGVKALFTLFRIRLAPKRRLFPSADEYHTRRHVELAAAPHPPELPSVRRVDVRSGQRRRELTRSRR